MLSKGHHFPNVTLAVILDADLGINFPDYKALERTFQLITQASGRAGRGDKKGRVIIQTRDTQNPFWQHILKGNYLTFYAQEISRRKKRSYPPLPNSPLSAVRFRKKRRKPDKFGKISAKKSNKKLRRRAYGRQAPFPHRSLFCKAGSAFNASYGRKTGMPSERSTPPACPNKTFCKITICA